MKGLGRNLLFWGKMLEKMVLTVLGTTVLCAGLMAAMDGGDFLTEMAEMLPTYLVMMAIVVVFINSLGGMNTYFALTVSFGSNRRCSAIAMQLMQHVIVAELMAVVMLCIWYLPGSKMSELVLSYPLAFAGGALVLLALGSLTSAVYVTCGPTIGTTIYIVILLLAIGGGIAVFFMNLFEKYAAFLRMPWILLFGILLDVAMGYVLCKTLQRQDLRF